MLAIPVIGKRISFAQVVERLRGNVLLSVFSELLSAEESYEVDSLELDDPIFLLETMDLRIKEGVWSIVGNRDISEEILAPVYKVWVEPPGEYRVQDIYGNLGASLSLDQASGMRLQKSFSPAVVEAALRGFHGLGPWRPAFEELAFVSRRE
ncbi:hypothetical protein [Streptomyces sp. NPDC058758]|uniref:hypothetical protein n=1 Tax=Streptomyces sp. NPDC058758 TaxID=3346627 RepID=UPI0036BBD6D2